MSAHKFTQMKEHKRAQIKVCTQIGLYRSKSVSFPLTLGSSLIILTCFYGVNYEIHNTIHNDVFVMAAAYF